MGLVSQTDPASGPPAQEIADQPQAKRVFDLDSIQLLHMARIMRDYARNKGPRARVAPDFLIGAHAAKQADALLTTDAGFFRQYFEGLTVMTPEAGL